MSALSAMQDKTQHLENSLSAETRIKLDLFSALGDAKRQLEIAQGPQSAVGVKEVTEGLVLWVFFQTARLCRHYTLCSKFQNFRTCSYWENNQQCDVNVKQKTKETPFRNFSEKRHHGDDCARFPSVSVPIIEAMYLNIMYP